MWNSARRLPPRLLGILALVAVCARGVWGQEEAMPVYHEPHHRMVFEAGPARILDLQIPPDDESLFHTHTHPILYVTLSQSQVRMEVLGGQPAGPGAGGRGGRRGAPAGPGASAPTPIRVTSTTSYVQQPVTHKVINVGNALFRAICVINESAGNEALTTMEAGFSGEAEVVNRWFRSYRLALEPGEATPTHRHATPAVVVQIAEGRLLAAGPMKWELNEPGRWAWFGAGDAHTIRNASDTRVELVEVEVRVP